MKVLHIGNEKNVENYTAKTPFTESVEVVNAPLGLTEDAYAQMAPDAEVIIVDAITEISEELMEKLPALKMIHSEGVAFNKIDLLNGDEILKDPNAEAVVRISGKNGEGTDQLLEQIEKILQKQKLYLEKLYGYQEAGKIQLIRSHGQLLKEEYRDDGIYVEAYIPKEILGSI